MSILRENRHTMGTFWTDTALACLCSGPVLTDPPLLSVYETGTKHKREHLLHFHLLLFESHERGRRGEEGRRRAAGLFGDD